MSKDLFANSPFGVLNTEASEAEIIEEIRLRVLELLDQNPELLFSYLYRLDVEEHRIKKAMKDAVMSTDLALAHLIWARQKQRLQTRKDYQGDGTIEI